MGNRRVRLRKRIKNGGARQHPWIYGTEIAEKSRDVADGDVVDVFDDGKRFVGRGIFNSKSKITVRILTCEDEEIDKKFFAKRFFDAIEYRKKFAGGWECYRLIHSEADCLPGLIVDVYGRYAVVQVLTLGMEKLKNIVAEVIIEILNPDGIRERSDASVRRIEGMEEINEKIYGEVPDFINAEEDGITYRIDITDGHKTGFYLDQRENRVNIRKYAKDARALDCFSYTGGFGLNCALGGAGQVVGYDVSAGIVETANHNAESNRMGGICSYRTGNAFDVLKEYDAKGERFGLIILDPPSFTKSKNRVRDALRGYKEINLRAMKILEPFGILATASCSYHISDELFLNTLREASSDAKRDVKLIEYATQSKDHPVCLHIPETKYLKFAVLEVE